MISSTPEVTVLLACMRFYLHTATASEVTSLLTADLNWGALVQRAIEHGVMPLLYQSLKAISILEGCANEGEYVPRSVLGQLQTLNRMNGLNNLSQTKELLKMLTALEKAGIEAIPFKGPVLAASAYGNIALRQFSDLDILVRHQDFWQAKAILVNQGYQSSASKEDEIEMFDRHLQIPLSQSTPESTVFNQQFQPSLLHSNPERSIDLHWGAPPRRVWNPDRFERLWENLNSIHLMGQQIKTFSPEVTLVIQCLNAAKEVHNHWTQPLKQVCDVATLIQAHPNLNWHSALELSAALHVQRLFLIGLCMTHDLLHIPLPQLILEKLARSQLGNEGLVGGSFLSSRNQSKVWLLLVNPLVTLDRSWYSLLVIGIHLQYAILPNQNDWEFISLPNKLHFLYYTIRPIRLLIKYSTWRKSFVVENKP